MTGRELLLFLQHLGDYDLDKQIRTEGCDCDGDCAYIEIEDELYLRRT